MADRDINGMQAQNWPVKDTSLTEKVRDNLKSLVSDPKLRSLYEALTNVIIASVKDSYGKSSDKKYIYQSDMLMARVRKAIDEKLSDLQVDSIKQLLTKSTEQTNDTLTKLLLAAFKTLSVSIDKDALNELVSKITVVVDKLLQDYADEVKSDSKTDDISKKSKKDKSELSKVLDALKSDDTSQKTRDLEIKQYQAKTSSLISKTLNAVNSNHLLSISSMIAGFRRTHETISNEVSLLQDKIEDAQSVSHGSGAASWFKTFILVPVKLLLGGLWKFLLKPMFYVGKFLLKPIGFLVKGIWDNFIKKPIEKLIELTGTVLGAVTSATANVLSAFFLTPKGAYALGYAVGYIWGRWIKPIAMPMLDFLKDKVLPIAKSIAEWSFKKIEDLMHYIGEPLLKMFKGEVSFNESMKEIMFKWALGDDIYKKDSNGNKIKQTDDKGNVLLQKDGVTPKYEMKDWSTLIYDAVVKGLKESLSLIWNLEIPGITKKFSVFGKEFTFGTLGQFLVGIVGLHIAHSLVTAAIAVKNLVNIGKSIAGLVGFTSTAASTATASTAAAAGTTGTVSGAVAALPVAVAGAAVASTVGLMRGLSVTDEYMREEDPEKKKQLRTKAKFYLGKHVDAIDEITTKQVYAKLDLLKRLNHLYLADGDWFYDNVSGLIDSISSSYANVQASLNSSDDVLLQLKEMILKMSVTDKQLLKDEIAFYNKHHKTLLHLSDEITAILNKQETALVVKDNATLSIAVEKANDSLLNDKTAEQLSLIARDASKKVSKQSALLAVEGYLNALEATLDAYGLKASNSSLADNIKLNETMLKDVSNNLDEFLRRMDKLQTTLEQMYLSKGKSSDEAKFSSSLIINNFKDRYVPMHNKDKYSSYADPIE